ncbi:hypothetical protein [Paenibacillus sp. NRS-1780]|uniref:hypothetical protein n=1 Tax=Paenibacillus sp. NRS-1780 TaxID=3233904 RepID=UPI003D266790
MVKDETMDKILKIIGISTIILGFVAGMIAGSQDTYTPSKYLPGEFIKKEGIQWSVTLMWWAGGVISGVLFYACGIALSYLKMIVKYLRNIHDMYGNILKNK